MPPRPGSGVELQALTRIGDQRIAEDEKLDFGDESCNIESNMYQVGISPERGPVEWSCRLVSRSVTTYNSSAMGSGSLLSVSSEEVIT